MAPYDVDVHGIRCAGDQRPAMEDLADPPGSRAALLQALERATDLLRRGSQQAQVDDKLDILTHGQRVAHDHQAADQNDQGGGQADGQRRQRRNGRRLQHKLEVVIDVGLVRLLEGKAGALLLAIGGEYGRRVQMLLHKGREIGHLLLHPDEGTFQHRTQLQLESDDHDQRQHDDAGQQRAGERHQRTADEQQKEGMHRHLEAGAVEAPDVDEVAGPAREQVAGAVVLPRLLVEEQQALEEILAHAVGDAGGDVAGQHAQQVAKERRQRAARTIRPAE